MVTRVTAPAEHHLIINGQQMVKQFGGETLSKFAVEKLIDNRITSRNFKAGLDFGDAYKARSARGKIMTQMANYLKKEFAHLYVPNVLHETYVEKDRYSNDVLIMQTMYDKAVERYVRRVNAFMASKRVPIVIQTMPYNNIELDKIEIQFRFHNPGGRSTFYYYKIFCFIPEIIQFFKSLSRKATYKDQDAKLISRSKFSGWVGSPNQTRNARDQRTPAAAANGTTNRARGRQAD